LPTEGATKLRAGGDGSSNRFQTLFEGVTKDRRKGLDLEGFFEVLSTAFMETVKTEDGAHGEAPWIELKDLDGISGGEGSGFENPIVEAASPTFEKGLEDGGISDFVRELETRQTATGDLENGTAKAMDVSDADLCFEKTGGGDIFTEGSVRERGAIEELLPMGIVFGGITVDGMMEAAVDGEVGLRIPFKPENGRRRES
jgi:hypothetical protein